MTTVTVDDIITFAERVERLCNFLIDGLTKDGSDDVVVVQKLKDDAADLQQIKRNANVSIEGLADHMKGL